MIRIEDTELVVPIENNSKALARICIDEGFVVNNISARNKDGELYVSMPVSKQISRMSMVIQNIVMCAINHEGFRAVE